MAGRNIKRKYQRSETLKIRISKPHLDMLARMQKAHGGITSQADIIERALEHFGLNGTYKGWFKVDEDPIGSIEI